MTSKTTVRQRTASASAAPAPGLATARAPGYWAPLVLAAIATFLVPLDVTITAVALPAIEHDIHTSFAQLQWVINTYNIAYTACLLAVGILADRYGRRLVFVIGLLAFLLTSLIAGIADTAATLIAARAAQGLAAGAMLIAAVAIMSFVYEGKDRGFAFGVWGSAIGAGVALGPVLGGMLTDLLSWRAIFLVNVPVVAILIAISLWRIPESRNPSSSAIDWSGLAASVIFLSTVCLAMIEGTSSGWLAPLTLGSFAVALMSLVAFVVIERQHPHALFDFSLFKIPEFSLGSWMGTMFSLSYWAMVVYLPTWLQATKGMHAFQAGLAMLPLTLPMLLLPPLAARLITRGFPVARLLAVSMLLVSAGFAAVATLESPWIWAGMIVAGIGGGLMTGEVSNIAIAAVPAERSGIASGINVVFRHGSFTVGIALLGGVLAAVATASLQGSQAAARAAGARLAIGDLPGAAQLLHAAPEVLIRPFQNGISAISIMASVFALLGALALLAMPRR